MCSRNDRKKSQESIVISNRLLTPCHTRLRRPRRGPFSHQGVSTKGVRHSPDFSFWPFLCWKRLKGKNPEGKNFRKLLRRKQSSAKISKISRNTIKSSKSDIFYLLRNLLKYLPRTFFSSTKFSEVFTLCVFTLWLFLFFGLACRGDS